MIGIGTIANVAAIIAGSALGVFARNGLSERFKNTVMQAISLSVVMIGISGTLEGIFYVAENGGIKSRYIMVMILSLVAGGLTGEALSIEQKLDKLGEWFQRKAAGSEGSFAQGFVTATLVYCVGAMAIVGSLEDGLMGDAGTLFAKSILDGVTAIIFTTTMGIGVAFSALPVLIYQGSITLLAGIIKPWLTEAVITQMSIVGSVLIMGIGINMLDIKKIKVGNLLPSIFMPLVYYVVCTLLSSI